MPNIAETILIYDTYIKEGELTDEQLEHLLQIREKHGIEPLTPSLVTYLASKKLLGEI